MLPLPAPQKVKCFRVCFRFQLLSSTDFRLHKNLTASSFRFHIPDTQSMQVQRLIMARLVRISKHKKFASYLKNEKDDYLLVNSAF